MGMILGMCFDDGMRSLAEMDETPIFCLLGLILCLLVTTDPDFGVILSALLR